MEQGHRMIPHILFIKEFKIKGNYVEFLYKHIVF